MICLLPLQAGQACAAGCPAGLQKSVNGKAFISGIDVYNQKGA